MTIASGKVLAIAAVDIRLRFRRLSAVVTLLVIAAGVYLIMPDLRSGTTLMAIGGSRVIYNSEAVALGTGMFCSILLVMVGFYVASNSIRRDLVSRTGPLIAATPLTNTEYLLGKFLAHVVHLGAVAAVCMASSMIMFLIRGERALEPFIFLRTYAWLVTPSIMFCSAAAVAFEALPLLSGRLGDVVYFFLWGYLLAVPAVFIEKEEIPRWVSSVDIIGLASVIRNLKDQYNTLAMSIGMTSYNPAKPPLLYTGFVMSWAEIGMRILACCFLPSVLFTLGVLWFHRFNPVRIRRSLRNRNTNIIGKINALLKPVTRPLTMLAAPGAGSPTFIRTVRADYVATLLLSPLTPAAILVCAVLSMTLPADDVQHSLLPVIVGIAVAATADIATRDHVAGTRSLLFTAPRLRPHYVAWKLASAAGIVLSFMAIPAIRLLPEHPLSALTCCAGMLLIACTAVGFGVLSGNPKPFVAIFLMLLYIALNAKTEPTFDFAGFGGNATTGVRITYAAIALAVLAAARLRYQQTLTNV